MNKLEICLGVIILKLIKRDLFIKLMHDDETECYYIYIDNNLVYRFYTTSRNSAIKVYYQFLKGDIKNEE